MPAKKNTAPPKGANAMKGRVGTSFCAHHYYKDREYSILAG